VDEAYSLEAAFVRWHLNQHHHSDIRFMMASQRQHGEAVEICRYRVRVYELARQLHPLRWSKTTRCWHQPEVLWLNQSPPEIGIAPAKLIMAVGSGARASSFLAIIDEAHCCTL